MAVEQPASRVRFEQVFGRTLAAAVAAQDPPDDGMTLAEAGLDSYQTLSLMMDLEGEFHALWPVEKMVTLTNSTSVAELREAAWSLLFRGEL